ncbi:class I SAM-dependent methyltransferase [Thalassotalea sp. M1531]|uniref:Class I SAM-dependent methyltransferase n=1 Tax=Thalassotalea algicola TaxID=2716224 RepID=A0A7Y0LCJ2_9GAMM|nr:class I SAM-dependent methyltransferase [Thalassotalea algicola]NMP32064.1 class I SAM-dependent methyltransferase [Thalassotalea algicola]
MPYTVNEDYRTKKIARLAREYNSVLDVGCAQSPNLFLSNKVVTGLDLNDMMLPSNYHTHIVGRIEDLLVGENRLFDAIIAGELIEHLLDPISFLKNCYSLLKPDGAIILSTPNPHSIIETILTTTLNRKYFYTKDHVMLFPQRWLVRMLEISGFKNVKLHSGGFPIPAIGLIPCPRFFCHQTIAIAYK